ncbi:MAG: hypothetical protein HY973_01980, partial [Candidatus Kerfeldbacteria bacterium]|nr:hypothetical protein [Candidatus Kerfeldbacteria bacterium]
DTAELKELLSEAKSKGDGIVKSIKSKDFDEEEIIASLEDLETLKMEFENKMSELTGEEEERPWERGPKQFEPFNDLSKLKEFIPQKPQAPEQTQPAELETQPVQ